MREEYRAIVAAGFLLQVDCPDLAMSRHTLFQDLTEAEFIKHIEFHVESLMLRFTCLTNAFSKKVENHALAVALFTTYYKFVRIHKTLRVTPAMAAGITDKLWEIGDIVDVLEKWETARAFAATQPQNILVR